MADRASGEVYLSGELERGIDPDGSTWTLGGGAGEDGCLLSLAKLNLELLQRPWQHSESWWPRLLVQHPLVAWDDGQCLPQRSPCWQPAGVVMPSRST